MHNVLQEFLLWLAGFAAVTVAFLVALTWGLNRLDRRRARRTRTETGANGKRTRAPLLPALIGLAFYLLSIGPVTRSLSDAFRPARRAASAATTTVQTESVSSAVHPAVRTGTPTPVD